jgi:hypothetical protein
VEPFLNDVSYSKAAYLGRKRFDSPEEMGESCPFYDKK